MEVRTFPSGPLRTNAYLVGCSVTHQGVIIDPALGSKERLISAIERLKIVPVAIFLTHSHWDHFGDLASLKREFDVPIYVHPLDLPNVKAPGADGLPMMEHIEGCIPEKNVVDGDKIVIGKLNFSVLHTPGHSPGGVCYYEMTEGVLFSGDTLFKGSIGTLSLPTAEPEKMLPSLQRLMTLPKHVVIYPGHGPKTTFEAEAWLPQAKNIFGL